MGVGGALIGGSVVCQGVYGSTGLLLWAVDLLFMVHRVFASLLWFVGCEDLRIFCGL